MRTTGGAQRCDGRESKDDHAGRQAVKCLRRSKPKHPTQVALPAMCAGGSPDLQPCCPDCIFRGSCGCLGFRTGSEEEERGRSTTGTHAGCTSEILAPAMGTADARRDGALGLGRILQSDVHHIGDVASSESHGQADCPWSDFPQQRAPPAQAARRRRPGVMTAGFGSVRESRRRREHVPLNRDLREHASEETRGQVVGASGAAAQAAESNEADRGDAATEDELEGEERGGVDAGARLSSVSRVELGGYGSTGLQTSGLKVSAGPPVPLKRTDWPIPGTTRRPSSARSRQLFARARSSWAARTVTLCTSTTLPSPSTVSSEVQLGSSATTPPILTTGPRCGKHEP